MTSHDLPENPRGCLRLALREGLIIAGLMGFWLGGGVLLAVASALIGLGLHAIGGFGTHLLADGLRRTAVLWPTLSSAAIATTGLYVVVRAGSLLIDHHRAAPRP